MSTREVVIADLGMGNLRSVARALERAGGRATITHDPDLILKAPRVVVPGQGAFRDGGAALARGFASVLREVIARGTPYLGLCVGMQLLFERSEEAPDAPGLGHFAGSVVRFDAGLRDPANGERLKVPHMGWNLVKSEHALLPREAWFYFVHSYHCVPADPSLVVGRAHYGIDFCTAVARDNVFACQFHPEKSQEEGHLLLTRFLGAS